MANKNEIVLNVEGVTKNQSVIEVSFSRTDKAALKKMPQNEYAEMAQQFAAGLQQMFPMPVQLASSKCKQMIEFSLEEYESCGKPTVGDSVKIIITKAKGA